MGAGIDEIGKLKTLGADALNAAIPATPTTLSINDLVQSLHHSGAHVLTTGTFTTSSVTVPADTGRTEKDGFFDHCWLVPTAGATAYQPRRITAYAKTGGVFTMATGSTFSAVPGLVAYEIWSAPDFFIIGRGIFTTTSTSAPVDTGRMEITGYWNGQYVMPLEGAAAFIACPISSFTAGGTFNLATGNVFPVTPGLVHYVILSYAIENAAGADSTSTATVAASIGNKSDAAVTTVGATASILAYIKGLLNRQARSICVLPPFFSAPQASAVLPATGAAADVTLPSVTVAGIPAGATLVSAYCFVLWRMTHNSNAAANQTTGAQNLQVRVDTPGAYATFCVVPDNSLVCGPGGTSPTGDGPGGVFRGELDVKATIVGNDIYEFKWAAAGVDVASITLYDVQTGIIIAYSL